MLTDIVGKVKALKNTSDKLDKSKKLDNFTQNEKNIEIIMLMEVRKLMGKIAVKGGPS